MSISPDQDNFSYPSVLMMEELDSGSMVQLVFCPRVD